LINQIQYATITEQSTTFTIVFVQLSVFQNKLESERAALVYSRLFPGMPVVLMTRDRRGVPIYIGRIDIVNFLKVTDSSKIPWKTSQAESDSFQVPRDTHIFKLAS
jgi:hypothetical protein